MRYLISFELKKIWKRKITKAVFFGMLALVIFSNCMLLSNEERYTNPDGSETTGLEAIKKEKADIQRRSMVLSEKNIANFVDEFKTQHKSKKYWNYYLANTTFLVDMMRYYAPPFQTGGDEQLAKLSTRDQNDFYGYRTRKINAIINNKTKAEQTYWQKKDAKVTTPFEYGYMGGWRHLMNNGMSLFILVIVVACICILPVFSEEYQTGTDAIILTSKYGKKQLIGAKVIACYLFGGFVYLVNMILVLGISFFAYGTEGGNLAVQLRHIEIPYAFTLKGAVLGWFGLGFVMLLGLIAINMFISSKVKNSIPILVADIIIIFLPTFVGGGSSGLLSKISNLFPTWMMQPEFVLGEFVDFTIGNMVIDLLGMALIVYLLAFVIFVPLSMNCFRKHQVQ